MDTTIISQGKEKHKRTSNCACVVCGKPLYRRPFELAKVRHVACMEHRAEAQKLSGITDAQQAGLSLGREKGTNHRNGYKHKEESKRKASETHKKYWAEHPGEALARGEKRRGEKHYNWNGGSSRLNIAIRLMTENRKWTDAVKDSDGQCLRCGSIENLESHHVISLSELITLHNIKNTDDARKTPELWNLDNGQTLCRRCHYAEHGRTYDD